MSRILGFVRDAVMVALFPRAVTDAFIVAFKFPNLFRRLLGEGSLTISFLPVYVQLMSSDENGKALARDLSSVVFTWLMALSSVVALTSFAYMDVIMEFWVGHREGYAAQPGKMEMTIYFARVMVFYVILVLQYAFYMAVANAHRFFLMPALGPALFNVCVTGAALLPSDWGWVPGDLLTYGVVVGGVAQMGIVGLVLWREGHLPCLKWNFRVKGLRQVMLNLGPGLLGLGIFQIMTLVNVKFAARLPEGSQSYLYLADRILELPQALIAISLGAALLPTLSEYWARGRRDQMVVQTTAHLHLLLFLALPASVGLLLLGESISQVLFMRGTFSLADAEKTGEVIQIYSLLLLSSSVSKVVVPAFYAMNNTWYPALAAAVCLGLHIALGLQWVDGYGLRGLALATSVSSTVNMLCLILGFRYWLGPLPIRDLTLYVLRLVLPLLIMMIMITAAYQLWSSWDVGDKVKVWVHPMFLMGVIVLSAALYFLTANIMKVAESYKILSLLRRRKPESHPNRNE